MDYYAIYISNKPHDTSIKSFYHDKKEALEVFKQHKDARLKAFKSDTEAVQFYLTGPADPVECPKSPTSSMKLKLEKTPFKTPKSQELVAFRKNIESNNLETVATIIQENPRFLVSSGDTPTILKEGPRYNALHVCAISKNAAMCKLILQTIEKPAFIELLHGQRNNSTDEVSAILLDLYLNTPDKGRGETPLHFAVKFGAVGVVEALIAYPQCKMTENSDGLFPKDIICSRSNDTNNDLKKAIENLLTERFFVPVLRSIDNSVPPVVGKPFTPSNPPNLEDCTDKFSPKLEIKAYAGPMDKEKALKIFKRWKTPPRLIISPTTKFTSPNKSISISKNPMNPFSSPPPTSTPVTKKAGRRALFPNNLELVKNNSLNNNVEIPDNIVEENQEEIQEEEEEEKEDNNGNNLSTSSSSSSENNGQHLMSDHLKNNLNNFRSPFRSPLRPNAIRKIDPPGSIFKKYRDRLQNSFSTFYDENDESRIENDFDDEADGLDQSKNTGNFSYFCDETNSFYENDDVVNSPSFKERKLRLTDTEKGLEIIGRSLADDHSVGWKEFWGFLGTFTNITSDEGLVQFEQYLLNKKKSAEDKFEAKNSVKFSVNIENPNDSMQSLCACLQNFHMHKEENENKRKSVLAQRFNSNNNDTYSKIVNPYLCLDNSLQVFANRFVKHFDTTSYYSMDFETLFRSAIIDCFKKLHTLICNYRRDIAFCVIDFSKVHSRYAYLIIANIEGKDPDEICNRIKYFIKKYHEVSSTGNYECAESIECLINFLEEYMEVKGNLIKSNVIVTEEICRCIWKEDINIRECKCRIETAAKTGTLERLNKRREYKKKYIINNLTDRRDVVEEDDDDDDFYSCVDSDSDDDLNATYGTPPESPTFFDYDFEREEEEDLSNYKNFIEGDEATKTDMDVLNALGSHEISKKNYPNIYKWKLAISKKVEKDNANPVSALQNRYRISSMDSAASSGTSDINSISPISTAFQFNDTGLGSIERKVKVMQVSDFEMRTPPPTSS